MVEYSVNSNRYRVPKNLELMVDYVVYGENSVKIHCLGNYFHDSNPERIDGSRFCPNAFMNRAYCGRRFPEGVCN